MLPGFLQSMWYRLLLLVTTGAIFVLLFNFSKLQGPFLIRIIALLLFSVLGALIGLAIVSFSLGTWSGRLIILAGIAVYLVFFFQASQFAQHELPASALIVSGGTVTRYSNGPTHAKYIVQFSTATGSQVTATLVTSSGIDTSLTSSIPILYDSTNPQHIKAAAEASALPIWVQSLVGALGITFLVLMLNALVLTMFLKRK